jgi:MinD-like ATPase involved in chromosome partitioning or flagellar assembly
MVHCNKGGAGKSMLTASIAYGLAQSSPVALADMNTSGGYIHGAFDKWLRMPENGGFRSASELLDVHGLSVLSNRINHANARKIDPEQLATAMIKLKPHDKRPLNLVFLPGIRSQRDYGIGRTDNTRTPAQELLIRPEWAQELLENLRTTLGGASYVVLDTGDSEVNAPSSVMFTRSDLIVWVVDCTSWRLVEDEFTHLRRILEEYGGHLKARVLVVANKIASDADRAETPESPTFQEVRKMFITLASGGAPVEVVPVRQDRRAIVLADNAGLPVLAIADEHPELRLAGDLVELINTINGSMQRNIVAGAPKKKGGLGALFGKRG